jgi:hypothetical protein
MGPGSHSTQAAGRVRDRRSSRARARIYFLFLGFSGAVAHYANGKKDQGHGRALRGEGTRGLTLAAAALKASLCARPGWTFFTRDSSFFMKMLKGDSFFFSFVAPAEGDKKDG